MKTIRDKRNSGLTLIEIMISIVVVIIAVIGAMGYRYYCALDARKADVQTTAARLGSMLLENWKAAGGYSRLDPLNGYDPEDLAFDPEVIISDSGGIGPGGFDDEFGNYLIEVNRVGYYATLSYQDTAGQPRVLSVCVAWMPRDQAWDAEASESVGLTTHVN
jgi:type II secretory pathway pseudopilin PulG